MQGGQPGAPGRNLLQRAGSEAIEELPYRVQFTAAAGRHSDDRNARRRRLGSGERCHLIQESLGQQRHQVGEFQPVYANINRPRGSGIVRPSSMRSFDPFACDDLDIRRSS